MAYNFVSCPHCKTKMARYELYMNDCYCPFCNNFIDLDEIEGGDNMESLWDEEDYYWGRNLKKDTTYISTFFFRFVVDKNKVDYDTIKASFENFDGSIDCLQLEKEGIITRFLETAGGKKLLSGLKIDGDKLEEYSVVATFTLGDKDDSKKILVSTLCDIFPLCLMREEGSSYIMANNKGLAKGVSELTNEDEVEQLSLFLTGYEKYKVLCYYLYWTNGYKSIPSKEILVMWDKNSLVSLDTLRTVKEVPLEWESFLEAEEGVLVSTNKDDKGTFITFETMIEDDLEKVRTDRKIGWDDIVNIISLRGIADYSLLGGLEGYGEDDEDDDVETK